MRNVVYPIIDQRKTGERIRQLRLERGITVEELRDFFRFADVRTIYHWQAGTSLPSVDHLLALSVLFEMPMNDILVLDRPQKDKPHREPQRKRKKLTECILCMAA